MTDPYQHNCGHQDEGWCLTCVGNLEHKIQRLRKRFDLILNLTRIALHRPLGPDELRQFAELEHELKLDAWKIQARAAIKQGQTLADFVDHCEQTNRPIARKAYLKVRKEQGFVY